MSRWDFPYQSQRMPLMADQMVATSQPLAAQAGIDMLRQGGNAVDAAIATAITLTVVEPTSNGLGSDAFAMIYHDGELTGVNGSGRSPQAWRYEQFADMAKMPQLGWSSVTVPGCVSVWVELSRRFGKLDFEQLFSHAIAYAKNGYVVSPITAAAWKKAQKRYANYSEFKRVFLPGGKAPECGERFFNSDQAITLAKIAASNGRSFYQGELAEHIAQASKSEGGLLTTDDLSAHKPQWVEPLSIDYYGVQLHELPPNGQGMAALIALSLLQRLDVDRFAVDSVDSLHLQIEAMKLGFQAAEHYVADPEFMAVDPKMLLAAENIDAYAAKIDLQQAHYLPFRLPTDHGTVYLSAADQNGMMVSFIQSNYMGFGSGVVIPATGISMQNRGCGFSLEQGHPNQVDGGKRPYHTIIPGFVTKDGKPLLSFGVMGGRMQPQGHVQMMVRIFNYGQNPQSASDSPRWCVLPDGSVAIEAHFPQKIADGLANRGHSIARESNPSLFGGAQIIMKQDQGQGYIGASDHRKDGCAAGY